MYSEARNAVQVMYTLGRWRNAQNRRGQPAIKRFLGGGRKSADGEFYKEQGEDT